VDKIIVIASYLIFWGSILIPGAIKAFKGKDILGRPPVNRVMFLAGKAAMIICWSFMFAQALGFNLTYFNFPYYLRNAGVVLLFLSLFLMVPPNFYRGFNFMFGLSPEKETLVTTGVYAFTRNPYYLGMYLTMMGSFLYAPNPINLACGLISASVHHMIVLAEEKHLLSQHGEEYRQYTQKVRRYI
jgi:protein-S-isoprenylcysteine O-methyltransferase Ste14